MPDIKKISDDADMIVCGFAYKKQADGIHIFDLNNGSGAAVITSDGSLIETNMDDNGDSIVQNKGRLNDREINKIQSFIKDNYQSMYNKWQEYSKQSFYVGE